MQEQLIDSIYKDKFPILNVEIGQFRHKETGETAFCVMGVSTGIIDKKHMYVYNASEWEKIKDFNLEGTERIQEALHKDMIEYIKNKGEEK